MVDVVGVREDCLAMVALVELAMLILVEHTMSGVDATGGGLAACTRNSS